MGRKTYPRRVFECENCGRTTETEVNWRLETTECSGCGNEVQGDLYESPEDEEEA